MTRLLSKLAGTAQRPKGFAEPPFWAASTPMWDSVTGDKERIANDFSSYVNEAYKSSGVVFACILARLLVFSEARFAWRRFDKGRPVQIYGDASLSILERPWPNGTTGELLARMEQDSSLAGNFYATTVGAGDKRRLRRLRPDWVTIVIGSESGGGPNALDAEVIAYLYSPGGRITGSGPEVLLPSEVCHYSPIPDPIAQFRGMSWLTPVLREIDADKAATQHKLKFFENGATTNFVVTYDKEIGPDSFERFVEKFKEQTDGVKNAYKTLHLGGGADATVVGANLQQLDFKITQGAGETRIAAAAGVHPVIVGLSEGLAGSSLNAGNFGAAKRRFADGTVRPLWRIASASLEALVPPPNSATQLWYDDRDVAFLREDAQDAALIIRNEAAAIKSLLDAGFAPDAAIAAITNGDLRQLSGSHSGLFSVQLQPPGTPMDAAPTATDDMVTPSPTETP